MRKLIDMRNVLIKICGLAVFFCVWSVCAYASNADRITDNFRLLDQNGVSHELYYHKDKKAVVFIWYGNGCPIVRKSIPYIKEIRDAYQPQGVEFFLVNANPHDDRESIVKEARDYAIDMPVLKDETQLITEDFGVTRTAQVIVIRTKDWKIVYNGPMDERFGYESQRVKVDNHYLKDALESVLNEREVLVKQMPVKGCLLNLKGIYEPEEYTYSDDVVPILKEKCLSCHMPGGVGPWSMRGYDQVKGWGSMIKEVIRTQRMPPYHPDDHYGEFKSNEALSAPEARTLVKWIENGMPKGEGPDELKKFKNEKKAWPLGKADQIVDIGKFDLPASGILDYRYVESVELQEDVWLRGVDLQTDNKAVVHHALGLYLLKDDQYEELNAQVFYDHYHQYVGSYAPGRKPSFFPDDIGIFIPKGSKLVFQIHFVTTGKPETAGLKVGLYFHDKAPRYAVKNKYISSYDIDIAPFAKNVPISSSKTIEKDSLLYSLRPHMHYRGKHMRFVARYPDGGQEILLSVPVYKFQWQYEYVLSELKKLPAGTEIVVEGAHDNSPLNTDNPDPSKQVKWGLQSSDEMFVGALLLIEL